jgi:membrane-bound lytic murein transglycosylase MltF
MSDMTKLSANGTLARTEAAPSGVLRVGVFEGSPLSQVTDRTSGEKRGLGHDLGAEFARRLNVPLAYVAFQRIAEVIAAMKEGQVDLALSNATPARGGCRFQPDADLAGARLSRRGAFDARERRGA